MSSGHLQQVERREHAQLLAPAPGLRKSTQRQLQPNQTATENFSSDGMSAQRTAAGIALCDETAIDMR
jgi:hypothetical protein